MTGLPTIVDELDPIALDEVVDDASLLTRVDRKYVLTADRLADALGTIDVAPRVLEIDGRRSFHYRSTYFDTHDLRTFRDAAHGRPDRFKVRTRSYLDDGTCWIELKRRRRDGHTAKVRAPHDPAASWTLDRAAVRFLEADPGCTAAVGRLRPALTTAYRRATLVLGQRVTIDDGVTCVPADGRGVATISGDTIVVETKSRDARPGPLDRALWRHGVRPVRISKYGVGMAALRPDLPHNRWNRVLRRHVQVARATDPAHPHAALTGSADALGART